MRFIILYLSLIISGISYGQIIHKSLLNAHAFYYNHKLYVYGYEQNASSFNFKCLAYNNKLVATDSISIPLNKNKATDYLEITTDTMHEVINFYFQLVNNEQSLNLLRLNPDLKKICYLENVDASRVNSFTAFENEIYRYKNDLFIIKTANDSVANQYYLNKYRVKSMQTPFEYELLWQFSFERDHIHSATVMYADLNVVFIYAHVDDGPKKGQWILRLDAKKGTLQTATRLGSKLAKKHYLYSNAYYDLPSKHLFVTGSIYEYEAIDFKKQTSNFINLSKRHQLFLTAIDSLGVVDSKTEKVIGLPIQTNFGLFTNSYHLKIRSIKPCANKSFEIWTDMYEQTKPNCFAYYTSWQFNAIPNDIEYDITPSRMTVATKVLPKFISINDADSYGKWLLPSISSYDEFKYKGTKNEVLLHSFIDENLNPCYVLKKTNINEGTKQFFNVYTSKKGLEKKILLTVNKDQDGNIFFIDNKNYILFTTEANQSSYQLKINTL